MAEQVKSSTAELQEACNLAYLVAREDVDGDASNEVPKGMRSFLYLDKLPRRAFVVAQKILDEDDKFRKRVASRAVETEVGSLGYVWLHRPDGWEEQYKSYQAELSGNGSVSQLPAEQDERRQPPLPSPALALGEDGSGLADAQELSASNSEVDAIESELSNLRGLVDSLAGARDMVSSMPVDVESGTPVKFDGEYAELKGEYESVKHEVNLKQKDLENVRRERDEAQNKVSEALRSRATMEKELSQAREEIAALKNDSADILTK